MEDNSQYDFNYSEWIARYPEFSTKINPIQAKNYSDLSVSFFNPTKNGSIVCDPKERMNLFYLLVAHTAYVMNLGHDGVQLGGVVNSVSEGSVSISSDTSSLAGMEAWLAKSNYGQMFAALTKKYRSALYIRARPNYKNRIGP